MLYFSVGGIESRTRVRFFLPTIGSAVAACPQGNRGRSRKLNTCVPPAVQPSVLLRVNGKPTRKEKLLESHRAAELQVKMTKVKKEKVDGEEAADVTEKSYQELIANVNPIAQPLASKKLSKKLYKCVKKGENPTVLILLFA